MCLDDFLGRKNKVPALAVAINPSTFLRLFFFLQVFTEPNSKAIRNSDLVSPRVTLIYVMLSVSVMDSEEGYLQFAGFNASGGLFELLLP